MRCPVCKKGVMEKVEDVIEQDDIKFEAFGCSSCGEKIVDMKQLEVLADKYRKLRKSREVTFAKWGNSIAIRIPSEVVEEYDIASGKHAILTFDKRGIKITPT